MNVLRENDQDTKVDPVCGRRIRRADAAVAAYDRLYHFCSMACREAFVADPRRYVQQRAFESHYQNHD